MRIEDDRTKSWTSEGKWTEKETRPAEGIKKQAEAKEFEVKRVEINPYGPPYRKIEFVRCGGPDGCTRRAEPYEIAFKEIETQLEKINGKIYAINAAIEELTRRVFAGNP